MSQDRRTHHRSRPSPFATVVERNITALLDERETQERARSRQERVADRITRFTGSMWFVYIHLVLFGVWILVNLGAVPGVPRFDESFTVLAMAASVEAIFLSTFVLISQNRMQAHADRRADLDLQVSLLAEHEVTELIRLTREVARRMGVDQAKDPDLDELQQDVRPETVLAQMKSVAAQHEQGGQGRKRRRRRRARGAERDGAGDADAPAPPPEAGGAGAA